MTGVAEFPMLREAHNRFKDQGFLILAISLDFDPDGIIVAVDEAARGQKLLRLLEDRLSARK